MLLGFVVVLAVLLGLVVYVAGLLGLVVLAGLSRTENERKIKEERE